MANKPSSKFMAEYDEQLADTVEAAKESSKEVIKVMKKKWEEQDEKISCLENRQRISVCLERRNVEQIKGDGSIGTKDSGYKEEGLLDSKT